MGLREDWVMWGPTHALPCPGLVLPRQPHWGLPSQAAAAPTPPCPGCSPFPCIPLRGSLSPPPGVHRCPHAPSLGSIPLGQSICFGHCVCSSSSVMPSFLRLTYSGDSPGQPSALGSSMPAYSLATEVSLALFHRGGNCGSGEHTSTPSQRLATRLPFRGPPGGSPALGL